MCDNPPLFFGVEIELIANPRYLYDPHRRWVYYDEFAKALRRRRLKAAADSLDSYRKHPEHYDKWWITKDGSLKKPAYPRIALEAVSPILRSDYVWEREIDDFWNALGDIFYTPDTSSKCGTHIHVSPSPTRSFTLSQLQDIAYGIIYYEPLVVSIMPPGRQGNEYCVPNTKRSYTLQGILIREPTERDVLRRVWRSVYGTSYKEALRDVMQAAGRFRERYVLWNFNNICSAGSGTIEFRGGPGLRDAGQAKRWISFALAFIHLCLTKGFRATGHYHRPNTAGFWHDLLQAATCVAARNHLPTDWRIMNEASSDPSMSALTSMMATMATWDDDSDFDKKKDDKDDW